MFFSSVIAIDRSIDRKEGAQEVHRKDLQAIGPMR